MTLVRADAPVPHVSSVAGPAMAVSAGEEVELRVRMSSSPCISRNQVRSTGLSWSLDGVVPTSGVAVLDLQTDTAELSDTKLASYAASGGVLLRLPSEVLQPGRTYAFRASAT